jgi:hypothetical protein
MQEGLGQIWETLWTSKLNEENSDPDRLLWSEYSWGCSWLARGWCNTHVGLRLPKVTWSLEP